MLSHKNPDAFYVLNFKHISPVFIIFSGFTDIVLEMRAG